MAWIQSALHTIPPDGPVDRQAWFQEQLDAPTAEQQLQQIARNARRLNDRAAHLLEIVRDIS